MKMISLAKQTVTEIGPVTKWVNTLTKNFFRKMLFSFIRFDLSKFGGQKIDTLLLTYE